MAAIQPNGKIQFIQGVRLDASYEHTYYFASEGAQASFFSGKVVRSLTNQSYSRKQKDLMVNIRADDIYNCGYLRFQNTSFGNKWFYAFINEIEYVSNDVSRVSYEIDVIQTWFFDFSLNGNFVERIHTQSDDLFEHVEPDISPFGDNYVFTKRTEKNYSNLKVCLQAASNPAGRINGITRNNIYSQLHVIDNLSVTDTTQLNEILNVDYVGRLDAIVNLFEYPVFIDGATATDPASESYSYPADTVTLDNYQIVNKKCLCYPYNFLIVSNNQGGNVELRFEDFNGAEQGNFTFSILGVKFPTPEMLCYPKNHKRLANDYDYGLTLNNFPTCCFSGNAYTNYLAQNQNSIAISNLMGGVNFANSIASKNYEGAANMIGGVAMDYAKNLDMMHQPASCKGHLNSVGMIASLNRYGYTFYQKCLHSTLMRQVDDYFTKYGYAINRIVNSINRAARPFYTYVKLQNASIYGNVPANDCRKIESIHNNGITYWKSTATIGDYTQNNTPT